MTAAESTGPEADARIALRAPEPLATFNRAGYLRAADVHVAVRVGAVAGETDPDVLLAFALLVRVVRDGSTCLDLDAAAELGPEVVDDPERDVVTSGTASAGGMPWPAPERWKAAVAGSALVTAGVLRLEDDLLYLDRYWAEERSVCADLLARRAAPAPAVDEDRLSSALQRIFPAAGFAQQREATDRLVRSTTGVLTGGPGSGKTTTVAGFLAVLAEQSDAPLRVALTAPTGKAAARLQEAVVTASAGFPAEAREALSGLEASTLHRLLGWRPGSRTRFRHDRANTLPHDVVVVDESSMLSLTLTARLLETLRPTTRLVLVGDADQLASVDAGAVLGDLVRGLGAVDESDHSGDLTGQSDPDGLPEATGAGQDVAGGGSAPVGRGSEGHGDVGGEDEGHVVATAGSVATVVRLTGSHRYSGAIGELARAVRAGDVESVLAVLRTGEDMRLVEDEDPAPVLRPRLVAHAAALRTAARDGDVPTALDLLGRSRILCAHRSGPYGVRTWNRRVEAWLTEETGDGLYEPMYLGRPLLVTTNDYGLGLYNGDTGVVTRGPTGPIATMAVAGGLVTLPAGRLVDVDTMHAMTVHKSQGSEVDAITVVLPPGDSALLTRELLYTAITRARRSVTVVGDEDALVAALARRARRATGLTRRLATS